MGPAERTPPPIRKLTERRSGRHAAVRVTLSGIIDVAANVALVFAHVSHRLNLNNLQPPQFRYAIEKDFLPTRHIICIVLRTSIWIERKLLGRS